MDYQVNDSWKSRENTHNFFSFVRSFFCSFCRMFNKKSDKSSSDGKRQKVFLVMLLLLHVVVVVCTVENLQIHSKRAWHIQGDAFFPIVVVVVATCTMMYEQKKTHSIKYKIQTYSRIQTYVLCQQCEHHTKACFCSTKSQAKKTTLTIPFA